MSAVLGVLVTQNGPEVRLDFDADARNEVYDTGVGEENEQFESRFWSKGMERLLTRGWSGVTDVQLDPDGWWITFRLRPAVTLNRALAEFVTVFGERSSYKHLIVSR